MLAGVQSNSHRNCAKVLHPDNVDELATEIPASGDDDAESEGDEDAEAEPELSVESGDSALKAKELGRAV